MIFVGFALGAIVMSYFVVTQIMQSALTRLMRGAK